MPHKTFLDVGWKVQVRVTECAHSHRDVLLNRLANDLFLDENIEKLTQWYQELIAFLEEQGLWLNGGITYTARVRNDVSERSHI